MGNTVHFFCTRCRHLVEFPREKTGSVANCPHCRQALIIPGIPDIEDWNDDGNPNEKNRTANANIPDQILTDSYNDELFPPKSSAPSNSSPPPVMSDNFASNDFTHSSKRNGVENGKKIHTSDNLENFSYPTNFDNSKASNIPIGPDNSPPCGSPSVPYCNSSNLPPIINKKNSFAPPIIKGSQDSVDPDFSSTTEKRPGYTGLILFILFILLVPTIYFGASFLSTGKSPFGKQEEKAAPVATVQAVLLDGSVTYIDKTDKAQPDRGAFIFLFPENFTKSDPLTTTGLTLNSTHQYDIKLFKEKITKRGGLFLLADSSGIFDARVNTPGNYKILIVSANIYQKSEENNNQKIKEIEKYLFNPLDSLLRDYSFFWGEKKIDGKHVYIEHNFGRQSGRFLN